MTVHCPHCGKQFEKRQFPLGDEVTCIHCEKVFRLSRKETLPVPPRAAGGSADAGEVLPEQAGDQDSSRVRNTQITPLPGRAEVGGQLGGYTLERELGRGGMGVVFLANQESLGRKVAVKVLPQKLSEDQAFVRRFDREAQSLAKLNHPNIVGILDKGLDGETYYFVMEYVDGVSLRGILEEKRLTPNEALRIIRQVCDALEYAHDIGVVHRDIKPENILIDRKGNAKIADFGLARLIRGDVPQSRITHTQMLMGSPDYMAPEQRENARDVDHRADLYSLGVVLYEMLTGELPIGNFPPPSQKNMGLDVDIDRIVLKVLEKDRELRYNKASEVATEISDLSRSNGRPRGGGVKDISDWARGPASEIGSFVREHPWAVIPLVMGGTVAVVVLITLLPAFGWMLIPLAGIGWLWHATVMEHKMKESKRLRAEQKAMGLAPILPLPKKKAEAAGASPQPDGPPKPPGYSVIGPIVFMMAAVLLLGLIALTGPLASQIRTEFFAAESEEMLAVIVTSLVLAIPLLVILVLSFYARARAKRSGQRGQFFATFAILMTIVSLVWFSRTWKEYHREYAYWTHLEEWASIGTSSAVDQALADYKEKLADGDHEVRGRAAFSILRAEGPSVLALQGSLIQSRDRRVQSRAASVLSNSDHEEAIPSLISGLESSRSSVRGRCARGLMGWVPSDFEIDVRAFQEPGGSPGELSKIQAWWKEQEQRSATTPVRPADY